MKRIAFITTNKILGQSLALAIDSMPDFDFEFFLFLNPRQVLLDAEIFQIDIALIDVIDNDVEEKETSLSICNKLKKRLANCDILFLVSQDDKLNRKMAKEAKEANIIDDFVFYDSSLKYLLAKLKAFG